MNKQGPGKIEWCDKKGIPVFLKSNLRWPVERKEFPKRKSYGTCGHEVAWDASAIQVKALTTTGENCIDVVVYCPECAQAADVMGDVIQTEEDERCWLDEGV